MAIQQVATYDSLISVGDKVTLPIRRNGSVSFQQLEVDKSGDGEFILRLPDHTAIVINDRFYSAYEMELVGNEKGKRLFEARWSRAPAPSQFEDYEFTFSVRGSSTVCHGRARTLQRALSHAVSEFRKRHNISETKHLALMKSFSSKANGYSYSVRKL